MRDVFEQFGLGSFSPFTPPLLVRVVQTQAVEAHAYASTKSRASCCLFPNLLTDGDIGELVLLHLLKSYGARAALYAATCKAFSMLLPRVSQRLMDLGIAYWTGNQPPLKPPLLSGAIGTTMASWRSDNAHSRIAQLCHGADVGDVLRLLDGQWCTNSTMSLIIKSSGMDQDIVMTDASPVCSVPRLLDSTVPVVAAAVGTAAFALAHPTWHAQLNAAPFVVCALNPSGHWAALRVWKHGDAEVFDSITGYTKTATVQAVLDLLACFGWESGKHVRFYSFAHYKQLDSVSCGVITCAALLSLLREHQLGIAYADIMLWRHYFAHVIYCHAFQATPQGYLKM